MLIQWLVIINSRPRSAVVTGQAGKKIDVHISADKDVVRFAQPLRHRAANWAILRSRISPPNAITLPCSMTRARNQRQQARLPSINRKPDRTTNLSSVMCSARRISMSLSAPASCATRQGKNSSQMRHCGGLTTSRRDISFARLIHRANQFLTAFPDSAFRWDTATF